MLSGPPSISQQAAAIVGALAAWAEPLGGEAVLCANMQHLWEVVNELYEKPRLLVVFAGETSRGPTNLANTMHRVDRMWNVVVMRAHGFKNAVAEPGPLPEEVPFMDALEQVREVLRTTTTITEEFPIDYKGMKTLPNLAPGRVANVFMDAYVIEFTTANDITAVGFGPH